MPLSIYEGFLASSIYEGDEESYGIDQQFVWDSVDNNEARSEYEAAVLAQFSSIVPRSSSGVLEDEEPDRIENITGKKRGRGRPRLYLDPKAPRVFKHDIRRHYPTMFLNVMNSCDYNTFLSFFCTFSSPDMIVQKIPINMEELRKLPVSLPPLPIMPFRGTDWVRFHFLQASCFCADRIFRIDSAKVITRSDSDESVIVMDVVNELTYLYAVDPITMIDAMLGLKMHPIPDDAEPLPEQLPARNSINQSFLRLLSQDKHNSKKQRDQIDGCSLADLHAFYCQQTGEFGIPLLREPERVTIRTQLTLYLSASKHIVKMEIGDGKLSHAVGPTPRLWSKIRHLRWRTAP